MPPSVLKTYTLGCKVNQYETEYVRQALVDAGLFRDATADETADLCIVNTCTVTNEGDSKSRQMIRRLARQNPAARLIVMGCYATREPEEVARLPGVAEVVTDKRELPDLIGRYGVIDVPDGISRFGDRHRAYIKVQDGCLLRCSYCIIPQVRPKMTSRPAEEILREAQRLIDHGYRELVLTGIHLGHYGVDGNAHKPKHEWNRLASLVRRLAELPGEFRIRLSSIEATEVTRELLEVMAERADRVCPHLHICLQSGSDRILRRMKRRWGVQRMIDRCKLVCERLDRPALTTDVIVGFPGETDEDFQETCQAVRQIGFCKIHIFPFSPRRGTPAAEMSDAVPGAIKSQRSAELTAIESELRLRYLQSLVGRELDVLVERTKEEPSGTRTVGTACRYVPVKLADGEPGQIVRVAATHIDRTGQLAADGASSA